MYEDIVVVGNGKTSRENVEALIDDYIYANKNARFWLLSSNGSLSDGQVYAKQYLEEKKMNCASDTESTDLQIEFENSDTSAYFILWDEDDRESKLALAKATEQGIVALDLTNGLFVLTGIQFNESTNKPRPAVIEAVEKVVEENAELLQALADNVPPLKSMVLENNDNIREIARIFAEEFASKLAEVLQK
jgi:hypothetical protein